MVDVAGGGRVGTAAARANDWQHSQTVGNVTQFTLKNVSIDDCVFGVAAIGADGQESLISAFVSPVRRDEPLKKQ